MKQKLLSILFALALSPVAYAQQDSLQTTQHQLDIDEVVVTGSRIATDRRLLPMTISVLDRDQIESDNRPYRWLYGRDGGGSQADTLADGGGWI